MTILIEFSTAFVLLTCQIHIIDSLHSTACFSDSWNGNLACANHNLTCPKFSVIVIRDATYGFKRDCDILHGVGNCTVDTVSRCCTEEVADCALSFSINALEELRQFCRGKMVCDIAGFSIERQCVNSEFSNMHNSYSKIDYDCNTSSINVESTRPAPAQHLSTNAEMIELENASNQTKTQSASMDNKASTSSVAILNSETNVSGELIVPSDRTLPETSSNTPPDLRVSVMTPMGIESSGLLVSILTTTRTSLLRDIKSSTPLVCIAAEQETSSVTLVPCVRSILSSVSTHHGTMPRSPDMTTEPRSITVNPTGLTHRVADTSNTFNSIAVSVMLIFPTTVTIVKITDKSTRTFIKTSLSTHDARDISRGVATPETSTRGIVDQLTAISTTPTTAMHSEYVIRYTHLPDTSTSQGVTDSMTAVNTYITVEDTLLQSSATDRPTSTSTTTTNTVNVVLSSLTTTPFTYWHESTPTVTSQTTDLDIWVIIAIILGVTVITVLIIIVAVLIFLKRKRKSLSCRSSNNLPTEDGHPKDNHDINQSDELVTEGIYTYYIEPSHTSDDINHTYHDNEYYMDSQHIYETFVMSYEDLTY